MSSILLAVVVHSSAAVMSRMLSPARTTADGDRVTPSGACHRAVTAPGVWRIPRAATTPAP
jgi:hypothetical protein